MNSSSHGKHSFRFALLLSAGINLTNSISWAQTTFSLHKSMDQGKTWVLVGQELPSGARINALTEMGKVVAAATDRGIFISSDAGEKWQPAHTSAGTELRALCFAGQDGRIYTGTQKHGVLVSDDNGMTWKGLNTGLTDLYVRSLLAVGTKVYAGTDRQGVFVTTNAGVRWNHQRTGLPDSAQVFDLTAVGESVFAGLYSKGLYRWETDRELWVKIGNVAPLELVTAGKAIVVGHNPGGVFVSEDEGRTWLDGNSGLPNNAPIWTLSAYHDQVFVGTSGKVGLVPRDIGLFISDDRGKSWTASSSGLPPSGAAICFLVTKHFVLAAISSKQQEE